MIYRLFVIFIIVSQPLIAQLQSPSEFLGNELGDVFHRHSQVEDYYQYLAEVEKNRVKLVPYGKTYEGRPLYVAIFSTAENMGNLENIRSSHLETSKGKGNSDKAIVWLSYNVHGNESVSTEASMKTIYELLTKKSEYLEDMVVIMDPCINPDGRDRYVNWYNQVKNVPHQVDPNSKEHHEGWHTGRSNHYMFDLNRDWAWLTQIESQNRIKLYNKWMPHIHVDFHEQGVDSPYYFAPAAEPYHEVITDFQRDFQVSIGKNHAKYFDSNGWLYFTKEVFDLFYPSYGDTYPTYNGAIGMTYEQGGSGRAGLGIITQAGDTLTLKDRIAHHHTTGMSTVEVASNNVGKLIAEFKKFHQNKSFKYAGYVLDGNRDKLNALTKLLDAHEIEYGKVGTTVSGIGFETGKKGSSKVSENAIGISTDQPRGTLVKVLFEPKAKLSDSLTYDITAWSLPYAYGLKATAMTSPLQLGEYQPSKQKVSVNDPNAYGYVLDWNSMSDARVLAKLLKQNIRVRRILSPSTLNGVSYQAGTVIVSKADNQSNKDLAQIINRINQESESQLKPILTGFAEAGKDVGSNYVGIINRPKVAMISNGPTNTLRFGEIWHFFEQQLGYPLSVLNADHFSKIDLNEYNTLILPGGNYSGFLSKDKVESITNWVKSGGILIAMGGAINGLVDKEGYSIKRKKGKKENDTLVKPKAYKDQERNYTTKTVKGAIIKAKVDNSHPLAFGYDSSYHSLKVNNDTYSFLKNGNAAYIEGQPNVVSGFAGSEAVKSLENTLIFGNQSLGSGQVVYMVDNPLFRGFWENGKLFFANALFMLY